MQDPRESDTLERTEVPAELQPQLRLYRRLYLARIDIDEARATLEELLSRRIPLPRSKPPSPLLMALTTALVVCYARPFANSRGQSEVAEKSVPGALLRTYSSKEREFHEALLNIRNKEVAHSDADILDIAVQLYEDGDGAIFRNARAPFPRAALQALQRMLNKLEAAIEIRCEGLRTELPLRKWL